MRELADRGHIEVTRKAITIRNRAALLSAAGR
jgi:hypothetical protein